MDRQSIVWSTVSGKLRFSKPFLKAQYVISATSGFSIKTKQKICAECLAGKNGVSGPLLGTSLEERVKYRARPPGGINTWSHIRFCSDSEPFTNRRRVQRLLLNLGIKRQIYHHSCSSDLQRWPPVSAVYILECGMVPLWLSSSKKKKKQLAKSNGSDPR